MGGLELMQIVQRKRIMETPAFLNVRTFRSWVTFVHLLLLIKLVTTTTLQGYYGKHLTMYMKVLG